MAYVIVESCIGTKDTACADVCPVDCIHPHTGDEQHGKASMLFINPDECIDCDACVEVCPVDATLAEDDVPANQEIFKEINRVFFEDGLDAAEAMIKAATKSDAE